MNTLESLKSQAKRLRSHLAEQQISLTHSQALEAIAATHAFKDWNTASALSPKELVYPATDETLDQLYERAVEMAKGYAKNPAGTPLSAADREASRILLGQIGIAAKAGKA